MGRVGVKSLSGNVVFDIIVVEQFVDLVMIFNVILYLANGWTLFLVLIFCGFVCVCALCLYDYIIYKYILSMLSIYYTLFLFLKLLK